MVSVTIERTSAAYEVHACDHNLRHQSFCVTHSYMSKCPNADDCLIRRSAVTLYVSGD